MKQLILVRHGKSSWAYPDLDDFYRPLKPRGINDAFGVGEELQARNVFPDLILASPAIRAMNTAIIIARKIDFPLQRIIANESIYEASVSELLRIISRVDDSVESLMVFGHNPSFTSLVNQLQTEPMYNLPTTGTVGIALPIDHWADVGKKKGERLFSILPRKLD